MFFFALSAIIEKKNIENKNIMIFFQYHFNIFLAIFIERSAVSAACGYVQYRPQALKRSLVAGWAKKAFPGLESNYFHFVTGNKLFFFVWPYQEFCQTNTWLARLIRMDIIPSEILIIPT